MDPLELLSLYLTMPNVNAKAIPNVYSQVADRNAPLDHPLMLQANPVMKDIIYPEQAQLRQLNDLLTGFSVAPYVNRNQVNSLYDQIAASGQIPLDDPTMLMANPGLAQTLAGTAPTEEMLANLLAKQGANSPITQQVYQALAEQGIPLDTPAMLQASPQLAQTLGIQQQPQAPAQPEQSTSQVAEQAGASFGRNLLSAFSPFSAAASYGATAAQQNVPMQGADTMLRDTLGAFLYGMLGPADLSSNTPKPAPTVVPVPQPAPAQAAPAQTAPVQAQAPAQTQRQPAVTQADIAEALVNAQSPQAMPLQSSNVAPATLESVLPRQTPVQDPLVSLLNDVLLGLATSDTWASGLASGVQTNQQRGPKQAAAEMQNALFGAELDKTRSEAEKNRATANLDRTNAQFAGSNQQLESQKTQAEINRIQAETALAKARKDAVGQERAFTDQDYARAYSDVLKAEQDGISIDPENPAYMFGADFSAREKLNTISPNTARYIGMTGQTKQVLDKSREQLNAGEITKEEFASRLARAQNVHGPDAIRQYITGASNGKPKP